MLELKAVAANERQIGFQDQPYGNPSFCGVGLDEAHDVANHLIDVERQLLNWSSFEEGPDAPHDLASVLPILDDSLRSFECLAEVGRRG